MSLILWIIIGIILVLFITTTLWIIFIFIKHSKKDYNLYKSVAKSVFARKLSLCIIVIFYLISFGLVGGLTSALGRLNAEATDYIKENHLHQGVNRQTYYNNNYLQNHVLDQKTFYLATQGVIDFYNEKQEGCLPSESNFIKMLGGQDTRPYDNKTDFQEILDGSTSPLSYQSNLGVEKISIYGHGYSIHDIGMFWNTWYEGSSYIGLDITEDLAPTDELAQSWDHWKTYYYNGEAKTYELNDGSHKDSEVISKLESILNETIFYDGDENTNWTFEDTIADEINGLNTFGEVVFAFFDNNINKYFCAIGTYFFEYYIDFYDEANIFASSDVFEYQKTILGTDFLLQSYNKNQVSNEETIFNNPGTDKNGDYSIDTVTFYNNKGKEIAGPAADDDFFAPHEGSKKDPYQVYVSTEYYDTHDMSASVGNTKKLFTYDGPDNNGLYYEIQGSYRSPTYSFPMQTIYDSLQNPNQNAAILINTQSLLKLTRKQENSTTNYEFFGFSNIYSATNKGTDWFYSDHVEDTIPDDTFYLPDVILFNDYITSFYGDSSWNLWYNYHDKVGDEANLIYPALGTFDINTESINELDSIISYRSFTIIREIYTDKIIYSVIMGIFLSITIIVLILLIKKRIQDSSKQIGTIKALGYSPGRIASAYTIFPIIIILFGGIMALIVAIPLSLWFTSLYCGFFSLNLAVPYLGITVWLKIFIIPLLISMFIGYWMAYREIKKPTLDLLNNVGKDKPNWLVRGTSYLIPSFASFGFTYKTKGIGRAFFKSLLLFCAILSSMSITAFAFSSSTMTATMTKQVFDIIDYTGKQWEAGAPFVEDININDEDYVDQETGEYINMKAFDLFPDNDKVKGLKLTEYVVSVLIEPESALEIFQDQLWDKAANDFDFSFQIVYDDEKSPSISSDYYITWETAVAFWITDIALHVPVEDKTGQSIENPDLIKPINGKSGGITFNMLDPILKDYAINISSNIVVRYGKDATFNVINFAYKVIDDYKNQFIDLEGDIKIIIDWFNSTGGFDDINNYIKTALKDQYIFNDVVFNKNYYDGEVLGENGKAIDDNGELYEPINQTMTTATTGHFFETDLRGNLIPENDGTKFDKTDTYMEGYTSTEELLATNNIDASSKSNLPPSDHIDHWTPDDLVVNVVMTQSEYKELTRYKEATPSINGNLPKNQAIIPVRTKVWDSADDQNNYKTISVPVIFNVVPYDSIYPLGTFFLQEDLDDAINCSIDKINAEVNYDSLIPKIENKPWYEGYDKFIEFNLLTMQTAMYEPNYSVTYNIDTNGSDFKTSPFSIVLSENALVSEINSEQINTDIGFIVMVNNFYIPFALPLSINIIIDQGSRVYELLQGILYTVAFFALFIGITIVMIAMKDITDSNKREVSMFKAFGYSNWRATALVITPYLFVIAFAFIIAIPFSLFFLSSIGAILTMATGTTYVFALVLWQWIVVVGFIICLIIFLGFVGYQSYEHTNALEAISETNE